MRVSTSLLVALSFAFVGLAAASNPHHNHRPVWVRDVMEKRASASVSATPTGTSTTVASPTGTTPNGSWCKVSTQCHSGNCEHSVCSKQKALGASCYKAANCLSNSCSKSKCVPADSTGKTGDVCNASNQCSSGNCSHAKCKPMQGLGATCYKNQNCFSGNCVDKKCIADASVYNGKTCTASQQCMPGNYCRHGKCSSKRGTGDKCYKDQGCFSNWCNHKRCA